MPVLVRLIRLGYARRRAVQLYAVAQDCLDSLHDRRIVNQETKSVILLQQLMGKFRVEPLERFIKGNLKLRRLLIGQGILDDQISPLQKEVHLTLEFN